MLPICVSLKKKKRFFKVHKRKIQYLNLYSGEKKGKKVKLIVNDSSL